MLNMNMFVVVLRWIRKIIVLHNKHPKQGKQVKASCQKWCQETKHHQFQPATSTRQSILAWHIPKCHWESISRQKGESNRSNTQWWHIYLNIDHIVSLSCWNCWSTWYPTDQAGLFTTIRFFISLQLDWMHSFLFSLNSHALKLFRILESSCITDILIIASKVLVKACSNTFWFTFKKLISSNTLASSLT